MEDLATILVAVPGEVIKRSLIKTLGSILFLMLVFVVALFLVWAWWTGTTFERFGVPHAVTWWGVLIGTVGVIAAPILVGSLIHRLLARERLVIGSDRLQIIRRQGARDVVYVQIPFVNVSKCSYEVTDTERRIGVDLVNLDDPATYVNSEDLKLNKEVKGWHYVLEGGYKTGVATIHKKLMEKMRPYTSDGTK